MLQTKVIWRNIINVVDNAVNDVRVKKSKAEKSSLIINVQWIRNVKNMLTFSLRILMEQTDEVKGIYSEQRRNT